MLSTTTPVRWSNLLFKCLVALALVTIGYLVADFEASALRASAKQQAGTLAHALAENSELKSRLAAKDIRLSVTKQANNSEVMSELLALNQELSQQLQLYQQVLNVEDATGPFKVHTLVVRPLSESKTYHMQMLLVQGRAIKSVINGEMDIALEGKLNGISKSFPISQLLTQSADVVSENSGLQYRYRFFMDVSYTIALPTDFVPEKLRLHTDVYQWKSKRDTVSLTYLWSDILDVDTQVSDNTDS